MPRRRRSDPRLNDRRGEICRTAAQIFLVRGFDATSVNDVARALGMTKAGLYHYFPSKEALLFEIMTFGLDRVRDEVIEPVRTIRDPEERLRQILVRPGRIATQGRGVIANLADETRALPPGPRKKVERRMRVYFDLVRDTLAELKAAGRLRDIDVTVGAFGVLGLILWLPRWFREGGRLSNEQVADDIANLALGGLLRAPGASGRRPPAKRRRRT
jgi:AcrR family transcriptional regulator